MLEFKFCNFKFGFHLPTTQNGKLCLTKEYTMGKTDSNANAEFKLVYEK